jgi:hypothetical protein
MKQCYELMVQKKHLTKEGLAHVLIFKKDLREMVLLEKKKYNKLAISGFK